MKYINNPITYKFVKDKFIENNIPYDKGSLLYFSNKKLLSVENKLIKEFKSSTDEITEMIYNLLNDFKNGDYLEYYNLNNTLKELLIKSFKNDDLAIRYDWGIENNNPKLFEVNAESCGFITECSLIPRWISEISNLKVLDLNLYENYTNKLLKNLNSSSNKIFLGSLNYIYDIQNLNWIKKFIKNSNIEIINLENVIKNNGSLYFKKEKILELHKIYPWEWIIEDNEINNFINIKTTEPIWTILFNSKIILYLLWKKYKNHPFLLETYYDEEIQGKFLEKKLTGMQGASVIKSKGTKFWNDSILQKQINPVIIDKDILTFNTWIIDKKLSGIGVKMDNKIISNANHKFIPLSIEY